VVAVAQLVTGVALSVRYPEHAGTFLAIYTSGAIISFVVFLIANRATPRLIAPLTVALTLIPLNMLVGPAIEPRTILTVAIGFAELPFAVPLFMAWTRPVRTAWLVTYAVVGLMTVAFGFNQLQGFERMDMATNIVIGAIVGWLGGELLERLRERNRNQAATLQLLNDELHIRATTDALTGLANRRQLDTDLQVLSTAPAGGPRSTSFVMLDLDSFKRLNDELGHAAGDEALRRVSAELQRVIRQHDTIYRYGGEEFLLVIRDASLDVAAAAAERIRAAIADLRIPAGSDPATGSLTISGGVAFSVSAGEQWGTELAAADRALYEAKTAGRDRIVVAPAAGYDLSAGTLSDRRLRRKPSLRKAEHEKDLVEVAG
jgi:diguanylate cyclase (GGDEF)-like protein